MPQPDFGELENIEIRMEEDNESENNTNNNVIKDMQTNRTNKSKGGEGRE